ncbi:hypothetical protein L1D19_14425 [Vibrio natriegens]|uniref:hypothetical protein n=1 Tax=Vibrio natriegens TaxID=691 RepID=UPI001EFE2F40|nr:hypothetical protein [Vibrio natriegens]MCG9701318.1 hypothetical protein [Vibrio natriegens]
MLLKRVEIYFYAVIALILAMKLGITFESLSLNFGVVTVNNVTVPKVELVTRLVAIILGFSCCIFNWKALKSEQKKISQSHPKLISYVNHKLQETTGNTRDSVSKAILLGWSHPTVNTGAWTSYRSARKSVVVQIPLELLIAVKLESSFLALVKTIFCWLLPIFTTIALIVVICQNVTNVGSI